MLSAQETFVYVVMLGILVAATIGMFTFLVT
jgi:hypothetical protein